MLAYSYHSFMLPLIWDHGNKGDPSFAKLCRVFDDNPYWNNADPDPETGFSPEDDPLIRYGGAERTQQGEIYHQKGRHDL